MKDVSIVKEKCIGKYTSHRYNKYRAECADEREATRFHCLLVWQIARITFKNGFKRGEKCYKPLDIVLADDNNFYWLISDNTLMEISDDDIFGEGGYLNG